MEPLVSALRPRPKLVVCSWTGKAAFEASDGYYRKMRLSRSLVTNISKVCYRSKHKLAGNLIKEEVGSYGGSRTVSSSKILDKVSVRSGYRNLDDFIDEERAKVGRGVGLEEEINTFDGSLARQMFPSITVGSSPRVELYNDSHLHSPIKTSSTPGDEDLPSILSVEVESLSNTLSLTYSSVLDGDVSDTRGDDHQAPVSKSSEAEQRGITIQEPLIIPKSNNSIGSILDKSVSHIAGLSKKRCNQLEECDFYTLRKLLHHFPRTYVDLRNSDLGIEDGQYLIMVGKVSRSRAIKAGGFLAIIEVVVRGEVGCNMENGESSEGKKIVYLHLKNFYRGARCTSYGFLKLMENKYKEGDVVCVSGKVRSTPKEDHFEMREYSLDVIEDEEDSTTSVEGRPYPIYPSKGGLKPQLLREIIARALQSLPVDIDPIPEEITRDIGVLNLRDAYIKIHLPKDMNDADLARRRFIFDEFFYLQLGRLYQMLEGLGSRIEKEGLIDKYRNVEQNSILMEDWSDLTRKFLKLLPYSLTKSQLSAVSEVIWDLKRPVPMNRLLQGDVGCGKTAVAFLACMEVVGSGYQAAYMVPTELLAIQHHKHLFDLLQNLEPDCRPSVALLTGSTPTKQARMIRNELQTGDISIVIGTHSLIAESVQFSGLRLAVIDEQHRFGVIQRGRFNSKLWYASECSAAKVASHDITPKVDVNMAPHVLAMSATPIPRSLALALYGDMTLTQITDMPPGRLPIETTAVEGNEKGFEKVYEMMQCELEAGGKVYLVYPIIEQSELLPQLRSASGDFEEICSRFSDYSCGLLHGRMKGDEKERALRSFRDGETQILLATQVIEIGIDVPDASMMVVMNGERFGMAQLHQLRGRVGRGTRKSRCILVGSTKSSLNRLKVLEHSSDGFHLAKVDLLLRGPGDLLGKKQSGHLPEFPIARLEIDGSIIQDAHVAALRLFSCSHDLEQFPLLKAELSMRQPLSLLGD